MSPLFRDETKKADEPLQEHTFKDEYLPIIESKFVDLIQRKSGIVFDRVKRKELKQNLIYCIREMAEDSFSNYYQRLLVSPQNAREWKKLINFITINETYFFRVKEQFDILESVVVPELLKRKTDDVLRIWSAGTSSGEEVYSLIIALKQIPGLEERFKFEVLGTDINEEMLYIARKGVYSGRTLDKIPQFILNHYFEPFLTDRFRLLDSVKQHARFQYLNLVQPIDLGTFGKPDIIFFRNVLIYFDIEMTKRLIDTFYHLLPTEGYLFLGPSETLWDISKKFQLMMFDKAYIYHKNPDIEGEEPAPQPPLQTIPIQSALPEPRQPTGSNTKKTAEQESPSETIREITDPSDSGGFPSIEKKLSILREEAALMIDLADYEKAVELLDEVLAMEPLDKSAFLLKVTIHANLKQQEQLQALVHKIGKVVPIFPELYFLVGRYYESCHQYKEAAAEYRKILFIHQEYLLARSQLLHVLNQQGQVNDARREARNILDQIASGSYKHFELPVGKALQEEKLAKLCYKLLDK